jgi:hypothetical protein
VNECKPLTLGEQTHQTHAWPPRPSEDDVDAGSSPGGCGSITAFAVCTATRHVAYSCSGGVNPPVVCVAHYPSMEAGAYTRPLLSST